jgi:hypothetical protein
VLLSDRPRGDDLVPGTRLIVNRRGIQHVEATGHSHSSLPTVNASGAPHVDILRSVSG